MKPAQDARRCGGVGERCRFECDLVTNFDDEDDSL